MAQLVYGLNKCPICGKTIEAGQEVVAFRAFSGISSPLSIFRDAVLHKSCFDSHPLSSRALQAIREQDQNLQHVCRVCEQRIVNPDDYFAIFGLTEDETHPLFKYHYLEFHRKHLTQWKEFDNFYKALKDVIQSENFDSDKRDLEWLAKEIEGILASNK